MIRFGAAFLSVSLLLACGGKSSAEADGPADGLESAECTAFDDDFAVTLLVVIINGTTKPIYLGQEQTTCSRVEEFTVARDTGEPLSLLGGCRTACVDLHREGRGGCDPACLLPSSIMLMPGENFTTTFDGRYASAAQLPARCVEQGSNLPEFVPCDRAKLVEPGGYVFEAKAGLALDCSTTSPNGACAACTAGPRGGCSTASSLITGQLLTARTSVTLDEAYNIAPRSADDGGNIASPSIDIVFMD